MKNPFSRYKGKLWIILIFGLGYAIVVTLITGLFQFLPLGVSLENQLFDKIQQNSTINSKSSKYYNRYEKYLEELCFINLGASFFNPETNRIDKERLSEFINKTSATLNNSESVFIDYAYDYSSTEDSLLIPALNQIKEQLILPYHFDVKDNISLKGEKSKITESRIDNIIYPQFKDCTLGYTFPLKDPYSHSSRYFKFFTDDQKHESVPWEIYASSSFYDQEFVHQFSNDINEIRFLLNNKDLHGKERAVLLYDAEAILNGTLPINELEKLTKNKLVFIGLFDDYISKYNNAIDKFVTPIQSDLNGTLLLVNAFLNLAAQESIKTNNWFIIFLINFCIGMLISMNYEKNVDSRYTPILTTIISFVVSILFFYKVAEIFFIYFQTKLSVGISLLIFQKDYTIYTWYQGFFRNK